jgi:hypothetical protein
VSSISRAAPAASSARVERHRAKGQRDFGAARGIMKA